MDRLPREYERQIAKKRLPGLLGAIASAENRAATLSEEKGRSEAVRSRNLRAVVAQLLADLSLKLTQEARSGHLLQWLAEDLLARHFKQSLGGQVDIGDAKRRIYRHHCIGQATT